MRTKDTQGKNTLYLLHYYDMQLYGGNYLEMDIHNRIAYKCCYGIEGRIKRIFANK